MHLLSASIASTLLVSWGFPHFCSAKYMDFIGVAWMKRRLSSRVLGDKKVLPKLRGEFYITVVRPILLYGVECWSVKNSHVQMMQVGEMRMLRWMCEILGAIKWGMRISKQGGSGLRNGQDVEARLRWFRCVKRRCANASLRRYERLDIVGMGIGIGRPKKYWREVIR